MYKSSAADSSKVSDASVSTFGDLSSILCYQFGEDFGLHTGDPQQDLEYERQRQLSPLVPEAVQSFLQYFQKAINEQDIFEIENHYENKWEYTIKQLYCVFTSFSIVTTMAKLIFTDYEYDTLWSVGIDVVIMIKINVFLCV